ncbi:molybdenum ABC transporter substrate-binding protein [Novosphingobium sp. Rr 2-17]|uniref:molybdate ABC transporter substrate-binding protein n=1 Tax=Novosphingobium sp. Rr 2-17 TaxID=555793 RepID=UPI000269A4F2|nr:molybdate ABC transporter substrate-binding protein [Novosphingobium sp. Rr 2-17]EIZ79658.1 molybdenum ABC transporter substrate-binding protein [Novosphingobium sp. Rr 2-17]
MMGLARFLMCLLVALGLSGPAWAQDIPNIAAAADLRLALEEVAVAFKRDTGEDVTLTFGSSGNFYRQLQQGAPFQLFLSADEEYAFDLARAKKTLNTGTLYAIGRLALVAPKGSPLGVDGNLRGLSEALQRGQITRFAIANPEHAPYGKRAEEALKHARLWQPLTGKLVLGETISQALQFATAGGAQGGIVSYSLVLEPAFAARANYALIPASWHQPLRQRMVLMKNAGPVARRFYAYIQQPAARRILVRYGFTLPGEAR